MRWFGWAISLSAALGCAAPMASGIGRASSPPWGTDHPEGFFAASDETLLFEQSWNPPTDAKGTLVIVHGLKDHSARYGALAQVLTRQGFAVEAFDLRGHGRSDGRRVWAASFEDYLRDLDVFLARVRSRRDGPILLFGHSMGGAICAQYVLSRKPKLNGLVLSAPAIRLYPERSVLAVAAVKILGKLAPFSAVLKLEEPDFSRDPATVDQIEVDDLIYHGAGPARTAAELFGAASAIRAHAGDLSLPLLVMHGTSDKLTDPAGSELLVERAASADKSLKLYQGLAHDLFHEPEKEQVIADLTHWLLAHLADLPQTEVGRR